MKMKQLPLDDASDEQIREFCETMDLEPGTADRFAMIALLSSAWPQPYILIADVGETADSVAPEQTGQTVLPTQQRLEGGLGLSDPIVKLRIGQTEQPGGKDPVPVSVNGRNIVIQRGLVAEVPYRYYDALTKAKRGSVTQNEKTNELIETEISNYPLEVIELPSREEIAEFHARTNDLMMPA